MFLYILKLRNNKYYIGKTNDVDKRIRSSWEIKPEEKIENFELSSKKQIKSKLEELRKKHQI